MLQVSTFFSSEQKLICLTSKFLFCLPEAADGFHRSRRGEDVEAQP